MVPPTSSCRTIGRLDDLASFLLLSFFLLQISSDKLIKTAHDNWSNDVFTSPNPPPAFQPELVKSIYNEELGGRSERSPALKRIMMLEVSQYLENYLWPNFDASTASFEHVMSIILMVNEKFRESIPAWTCFHARQVSMQPQWGWWDWEPHRCLWEAASAVHNTAGTPRVH